MLGNEQWMEVKNNLKERNKYANGLNPGIQIL